MGARATGAVLGWVSTTVFAAIAWWFVFVAETRWLALPGLIATVVAPIALWALYLIVADMRSGAVVSETGQLVILREGDSEPSFWCAWPAGSLDCRLPWPTYFIAPAA